MVGCVCVGEFASCKAVELLHAHTSLTGVGDDVLVVDGDCKIEKGV